MKEHFPGLMEFVNGGSSLTETERNLLPAEITPSFARLKKIQVGYNIMKPFLEPNNELYKMGLMKELKHVSTGTTGTRENGKTTPSHGRCIMCCEICCEKEYGSPSTVKKCEGRLGRTTTKICSVCDVHLCKYCFETFHSNEHLDLPVCHPCAETNSDLTTPRVQRNKRSRQNSNTVECGAGTTTEGFFQLYDTLCSKEETVPK